MTTTEKPTTPTTRCACGATLTVRDARRVTHIGLWCGHIDVTATTGDFRRCSGRDVEATETAESFAARVFGRVGLRPDQIPDAPADVMIGGSIACSSPHGTVVLVDHTHQDDSGVDYYARCVMVDRGAELAPASAGATGTITD